MTREELAKLHKGVYLAEGPWPGKAYFDAMRRARQRDAAMYLDYGFTRPNVFSRGSHAQRDVFDRITIDAAIRAGLAEDAETLLKDRTRKRGALDRFAEQRFDLCERMQRASRVMQDERLRATPV